MSMVFIREFILPVARAMALPPYNDKSLINDYAEFITRIIMKWRLSDSRNEGLPSPLTYL
ncbi:MAG: hypothetical protein ACP5NQ_00145 [Vulcanisaeta sp.]